MNYGPISNKIPKMIHGGDYNPDQWINYEGIWDEDFRLMDLAHVNVMTIGIFSWSSLEPEEGRFDFSWMDQIMDRLAAEGKYAILATPSGARPAWLSHKYPEVLRTNADRTKNLHGDRHNHCFTAPIYRQKTQRINTELAKRYKDHPALIAWHISNEFSGECHCDLCQTAFQNWLKTKYNNDLEQLNHAWWTSFWSHMYTDWSQILAPSAIGEGSVHGLTLDWKRFVTDQTIDFMENEMKPLRELTPELPITTNFMGIFEGLNYWKMARSLDVVSWDSYPMWHHASTGHVNIALETAFLHDLNRSLKGGKPFMLMESTPSVTNWQSVSKLKRPGMHLLASLQAIAHGSDTVQYFQWRKSRGSVEKFHGAVIDHCGHEDTRVFKDVSEVGKALEKLDDIVGTSVKPEVAIIYDWENRWGIEDTRGFNNAAKKYPETVIKHYSGFWKKGVPVDIIDMEQSLSQYKVLVAPMLYMLRGDIAKRIEAFVKDGGTFVATYLTGLVNENDLCFLGEFPGPLRNVLGIWTEETDSLHPEEFNEVNIHIEELKQKTYKVVDMCDMIHLETAKLLGTYASDFYAGQPALTVNEFGEGQAYYIAFRNNQDFEEEFYGHLIQELQLKPVLETKLPEGVSVQTRYDENNTFIFLMNFTEKTQSVDIGSVDMENILEGISEHGKVSIEGYGIKIYKK
jgi:beta-galactosidase